MTGYRKAPDAFLEALVGLGILEAMGEQTGAPPASAARAVTDGAGDNGIDAIYFDESNRRLYLVQSKWMKNGVGEPDMARSKTLWEGSMILFNYDPLQTAIRAIQCEGAGNGDDHRKRAR